MIEEIVSFITGAPADTKKKMLLLDYTYIEVTSTVKLKPTSVNKNKK